MPGLPGSVLFCCTMNAIRSPMAEGLLKHLHGHQIYVDSVGVRIGPIEQFAVIAMDEIGIDISRHRGKTFDDLEDTSFDLIISLSPEAQHRAVEMTRTIHSVGTVPSGYLNPHLSEKENGSWNIVPRLIIVNID